MSIEVYNTLTAAKEKFEPAPSGKIGMYVCGPTVYDSCHIGHARAAVVFDVVYRYLKYKGFDVKYVRNYTDVDDKVIKRANDEGRNFKDVADFYIEEYDRDMASLKVLTPDERPRVTTHMTEIVEMVKVLIDRGYAYESGGDVFFDVGSFADYGKLSKRDKEDMLAGARVDINELKRNELDFALWKSAKPGEPQWDSPWGPGRPGWHIECSVMSSKYLTMPLDIHGGGIDLIFPHHENEIAQSEAATGIKPFARYWIHNGHVTTRGEKISKSLGNFIPIAQLSQRWHAEAIRLFLLSSHYRSPVDFNDEALDIAQEHIDRFYGAIDRAEEKARAKGKKDMPLPASGEELVRKLDSIKEKFEKAMDSDFNTAEALARLMELLKVVNRFLDQAREASPKHRELAGKAGAVIKEFGAVLGMFDEEPGKYLEEIKRRKIAKAGINHAEIEDMVSRRSEARKRKDWAEADRIRDELLEKGVVIKDGSEGTKWSVK